MLSINRGLILFIQDKKKDIYKMNKLKASRKDMRRYNTILSVGYCNAQYLLKGVDPIAYSTGVYGWACDYYYINDVLISTGYSPLNSKGVKSDYALIRDYDNKARLIYNNGGSYDSRINAIRLLRDEFIEKVKGLK
jgi:hypothetical protein